jgi:glycosyltransferase involved in cell wall biosynthesis
MSKPLVSIVTRTLNRPCLAEAAAAVAAQTYRPLEWVVVDAAGRGEVAVDAGEGVTTRVVGTGTALLRSPAGNLGLSRCSGHYLGILDDDDLLKPEHVTRLVEALTKSSNVLLAYADVEVWDAPQTIASYYSFAFSHFLLTRRNLFPPNAALFDAWLVRQQGIRFDTELDFFDDWDFWLQAARHTRFAHVSGATAIYRAYLSLSGVEKVDTGGADPRAYADRDRVLARYAADREREEMAFDLQKHMAREATQRGELRAASVLWKDVFLRYPYDVEATTHFAECCHVLGNIESSADVLRLGTELNPEEPALWWNLGFVLESQGQGVPAAAARQRAIELDASFAELADGKP